jgi:hypothetical protein
VLLNMIMAVVMGAYDDVQARCGTLLWTALDRFGPLWTAFDRV